MNFANFGFTELLVVLVIVLVLFGAKRVPEIGASLGKGIRDFKRNVKDVGEQIRAPEESQMADRLPAGENRPAATDDSSREPKRLLN
jgi:sec-independent protein translocase protein TatA